MTLNDDIRALSAAGLFEQLSAEQLRLLAFGAERLQFRAGRTLYRQGDKADCGFVVVNGTVTLTRQSADGGKPVQTAGPGSVLGQLALITETEWMTGAQAETEAEVLRISRALFRRMLVEYPETAMAIHRQLSDDLQDLLKDIERAERRFRQAPEL
ncbi:MAG: cyclic nucleotide-binding domain-containing protein [Roseitalea sp.]|nr:cyclic nucleotide-binding domain-containing protein [Roseitalea sp.]MBO6723636.1 cyclic nucleotide-binding domain-containing protein [Roseitalea sp.]MBO6744151.1 cyclic nucleotide-binding domain-containing protein [Roseitalea sp.]